MRKTLIIAILAVATMFTACNKTTSTPDTKTNARTQKLSTISGQLTPQQLYAMSPGQFHNLIAAEYKSRHAMNYSYELSRTDLTQMCDEIADIISDVTGDTAFTRTYTSRVINQMDNLDMFTSNDMLKSYSFRSAAIVNAEPDAKLRMALTNISNYHDTTGILNGTGLLSYASNEITNAGLSGNSLIVANLYIDILGNSYNDNVNAPTDPLLPMMYGDPWYQMWRHKQIGIADAEGGRVGLTDAVSHGANAQVAMLHAAATAVAYSIAKTKEIDR